jgi:hypothetical protein
MSNTMGNSNIIRYTEKYSFFYSGGEADKQETVNRKISNTKHDITLYVCHYLFFPL